MVITREYRVFRDHGLREKKPKIEISRERVFNREQIGRLTHQCQG
jgi:hypothetical protein